LRRDAPLRPITSPEKAGSRKVAMARIDFLVAAIAASLLGLAGLCLPSPSWADSSPRLRTLPLESLPMEVGAEVHRWQATCGGTLTPGHTFARSVEISGRRFLALHFEALSCENRAAICNAEGCLHEIYIFSSGRFRRVMALRTLELLLEARDNKAVLQVDCGLLGCLRSLRWNGDRFAEDRASVDTEHIFGFAEGADVDAKGAKEVETSFTSRFGKLGSYHVLQGETAFRYVFADGLRASLGVLSDFHDIHGVPGLPDTTSFAFNGLSSEFRWQAIERDSARPLALSLTFNPQWQRADDLSGVRAENYALSVGVLVDWAILPDALYGALNVTYTPSVAQLGGAWNQQSAMEVSTAIAGAVKPGVFVGAEVRYASAYQGSFLNSKQGEAFFVGPTLFVRLADDLTFKAVWSAQVTGEPANGPSGALDLVNFERYQARVQLAKNF
jgi:hypothetical protein